MKILTFFLESPLSVLDDDLLSTNLQTIYSWFPNLNKNVKGKLPTRPNPTSNFQNLNSLFLTIYLMILKERQKQKDEYQEADVNKIDALSTCSGTLETDHRSNQLFIKSPRFPENYPLLTKCRWTLTAPKDFQVICR